MSQSPTQSRRVQYFHAIRRAIREFFRHSGLDAAAALSYFMVLSLFPALLVIVSLLALVGASGNGTDAIMEVLRASLQQPDNGELSPDAQQIVTTAETLLTGLGAQSSGSFWTILIGIMGALWTTSGYVRAFSRSMNRLYEVPEGRPEWKRRPAMLGLTLLIMLVAVLTLVLAVTSGPVARGIGNVLGFGDEAAMLFNWLKPPLLLMMAMLVVGLLYYYTPNVKRPRLRWVSPGTIAALVVLILSAVGFALYIANFASYSSTYGAIGGVIVLVLACWISNIALLMGAEVDIEFSRLDQLRDAMPSERTLLFPLRDNTLVKKAQLSQYRDEVEASIIRIDNGAHPMSEMGEDSPEPAKHHKLLPWVLAAAGGWQVVSYLKNRKA